MRTPSLTPVSDVWDWQREAACRGMSSSVFFTATGARGARRREAERRAQQICLACPVRQRCAEFALATRETYGIWGGLTEADRSNRPDRRRPRPPVAEAPAPLS
ncbi:WhiB family transcriptional regulator [Streptomyces sp. NPDC015220]|uniref:WhiB family transcriptional regulator n=1 Tax=Streptomyces sp. NPDC015220 TaxID=3364947 RepID=UPI0036F90981